MKLSKTLERQKSLLTERENKMLEILFQVSTSSYVWNVFTRWDYTGEKLCYRPNEKLEKLVKLIKESNL